MPRKIRKVKKLKTFRENYYSEEVLSENIHKKGDKRFIILFPYSQPDNFKVFSSEILSHKVNKDFSIEYSIKIHTGFDKREVLKDFFHNNWFKSLQSEDTLELNEYAKKFSFTDYELVESADKDLTYSRYSTFFRNHSEKFIFLINEAFVFDKMSEAVEYAAKMSTITICNKIKDLHDVMTSDVLRMAYSKTYTSNSAKFFKLIRPLVATILDELGEEYDKFMTDDKLSDFFNDYILNRRYRRVEFNKSRKAALTKKSMNTRKREKDV